jgi:hypothetical protein
VTACLRGTSAHQVSELAQVYAYGTRNHHNTAAKHIILRKASMYVVLRAKVDLAGNEQPRNMPCFQSCVQYMYAPLESSCRIWHLRSTLVVVVLTPHTLQQMASVYSANECIQGAVCTGACDTDWATEAELVTRSRRGNGLISRALVQRINHRILLAPPLAILPMEHQFANDPTGYANAQEPSRVLAKA